MGVLDIGAVTTNLQSNAVLYAWVNRMPKGSRGYPVFPRPSHNLLGWMQTGCFIITPDILEDINHATSIPEN